VFKGLVATAGGLYDRLNPLSLWVFSIMT
jgi:hypothetical protein